MQKNSSGEIDVQSRTRLVLCVALLLVFFLAIVPTPRGRTAVNDEAIKVESCTKLSARGCATLRLDALRRRERQSAITNGRTEMIMRNAIMRQFYRRELFIGSNQQLRETLAQAKVKSKHTAIIFPQAQTGETQKVAFHVSTPVTTGSLEVQARLGIEELLRQSQVVRILRLRIFAVGEAALETVKQVVGKALLKRKQPLPVLSLVGVAAFPVPGQLVEIESIVAGTDVTNRYGLVFLAGLAAPTGERTIDGLARVAKEAGVTTRDVLRVSCFYESPEQVSAATKSVSETFPSAESSFVLAHTPDIQPAIECEAVARASTASGNEVSYFNLPGTVPSPNFSRAARVSSSELIFTGMQIAYGESEADITDVFERIKKAVEGVRGKLTDVVMADNYWLASSARDQLRTVRPRYFGATVPAATGVNFSALPVKQATVAIEVIVAIPHTSSEAPAVHSGGDIRSAVK
jgi:enamine deaminase RidA (YjgF/YER057c/UK114 family)